MFTSSGRSDVGRVRVSNQDSGYAGQYLLVVADGMGGHAGGDVASHIAVNHLLELDRDFTTVAAASKALRARIMSANKMIVDVVDNYPQLSGLGTTLSVVLRVGSKAVVAHIGDSRIYRLRSGQLTQITQDHTFVQHLIDSGQITEAEAAVHPRRSVLMRVLGDVDAHPNIDVFTVDLLPNDTWVLCSDGLTGCLSDSDIASLIQAHKKVDALANALISRSLDEGAPDNVTVIVTQISATSSDVAQRASELVGSASADNPLKTLPKATDTGPTIPRAKAQSLPVHTGGIPIADRLEAIENLAHESPLPKSSRRVLWVIVLVALAIIGAVVWLVLATSNSHALSETGPSVSRALTVVDGSWHVY